MKNMYNSQALRRWKWKRSCSGCRHSIPSCQVIILQQWNSTISLPNKSRIYPTATESKATVRKRDLPDGNKIYPIETKPTLWKPNLPNGNKTTQWNKIYPMETKSTQRKPTLPNGNGN